ncbi:hypothetical protein [Kineosporia babensis]|uniref:Calcium-binding protein n=1 Tax=Kineosporia babensis TaxID=499548 RepID=A0A9X1SRI1_9ACTN|nr:hypothetical protein [Kineosporia babensis]MCD5309639.1 hypothetical protein [Kineosporia babensis]
MKILRRAAAGLVATAVVTSLTLLTPAAAQAAEVNCSLTPKSITVTEKPRTVKLGVKSDFPYWAVDLNGDYRFDADDENPKVKFDASKLLPSDAGRQTATVAVMDDNFEPLICEPTYTLLRDSALTVAVKQSGTKRTVSGTLKQVTFGQGAKWTTVKGQKVAVQYKAKSGKWVTTATVKTATGGKFKVTKKLSKRSWRVVYAGNATIGARTSKTVTR